jgi:type IV secretion system protein VirB4
MIALPRDVAARRDFSASRRIPYSAQLTRDIVSTKAGDLVQVFRLAGASFESADDETLNNWHERLNVTLRNIASPNVALWSHIIRRRSITGALACTMHEGRDFCDHARKFGDVGA